MPWTIKTRFDENFDPFCGQSKRHKLSSGKQPIIHRFRYIDYFWPLDPSLKNKFKKPEDLTIVTAHNYPEKSIFEKSLDHYGIAPYVVLKKKGEWNHRYKLDWMLEFLQAGGCKTEYLLFCDARDAYVIDDLHKALNIFKKTGCDLIFNSTMSKRGIFWNFPQLLEWTKIVGKKHSRYLNAGTYIGRPEFIQKVWETAVTLIGRFPRSEDEQDILRYLHPAFYPEMDIDYSNEIFYRN